MSAPFPLLVADAGRTARRLCAVLVCAAALGTGGCGSPGSPIETTRPAKKRPREPLVRVRLSAGNKAVRLTAPSRVQIRPLHAPDRQRLVPTPVTIRRTGASWSGPWPGSPPEAATALVVQPLGPRQLAIDGKRYPGALRLVPFAQGKPASEAKPFDVVNRVRLERYLPGVLQRELYDDWRPATFLAQAIAARSFALHRIIHEGDGRHYDVTATQQSQAYGGYTAHPLARRAATDTAGLVLTDRRGVIPAFYSSTCGGAGQSPAAAFGNRLDISALQPQRRRAWCSFSEHFRWGPIERDRKRLSRRLAAWGKYHGKPVGDIKRVRTIRPSRKNEMGRPVEFRVTDTSGTKYTLRSGSLRKAANFGWSKLDLPRPPHGRRLKSSFVKVRVDSRQVIFHDGRGFGHGVGLCQYGAEGMAEAGHAPPDILETYYPGAKLERAY